MSNSSLLGQNNTASKSSKFIHLPDPQNFAQKKPTHSKNRAKIEAEISQDEASVVAKPSYVESPINNSLLDRDELSINKPMFDTSNAAQIYLEQAQSYWQAQKWQQTIEACQQALAIAPELVEAHKLMGNALQKTGKMTEAMGYYAKAIQLKPDFAEVYANLGTIYAQQQNWDKAIAYYQQALKIDPNLSGVYRNLARIWEQKQETAKAQSCLAKSRQLEANQGSDSSPSVEQYLKQGKQLQQQGKLEAAKQQYLLAIKLESNCLEAYEQLLEICEQQEQWQQATQYCKIIVKINQFRLKSSSTPVLKALPPQTSNQLRLAPATQNQNLDLIQKYHEKAQINPNSAEIQVNLGTLYAREKNWDKAIAHFQKAIALNPNLSLPHRNLARALAKLGKSEAAKKHWSKAILLEGNKAKAEEHLQLGKNLVSWNKYESALTCYRRAIQLKPNLVEAYLSLGELLIQTNQRKQAILCYQQGIKYNPNYAELYQRLGLAYSQQHQWLAASDCYQKLAQLQPQNPQAYHLLAETLTKQEKWEEASQAYQQAIALEQ
ncbi:MAG: tetratricopeptide repeat protein [Pleurocapsa sp.]